MEYPDKIFVFESLSVSLYPVNNNKMYIRADIHEKEIAKLKAAGEWISFDSALPEIDRPLRFLSLRWNKKTENNYYIEDVGYASTESQGEYGENEVFYLCYGNGDPIDDHPDYWSYIKFPEHPEIKEATNDPQ